MKACKLCIKAYRLGNKVEKTKEIGEECYWCRTKYYSKNLDTR